MIVMRKDRLIMQGDLIMAGKYKLVYLIEGGEGEGGLTVSFHHSSDRQNRYDNNESNGERQAYYERGAYFVRHGEMNQKGGTIGKEGWPTRGTGRSLPWVT